MMKQHLASSFKMLGTAWPMVTTIRTIQLTPWMTNSAHMALPLRTSGGTEVYGKYIQPFPQETAAVQLNPTGPWASPGRRLQAGFRRHRQLHFLHFAEQGNDHGISFLRIFTTVDAGFKRDPERQELNWHISAFLMSPVPAMDAKDHVRLHISCPHLLQEVQRKCPAGT